VPNGINNSPSWLTNFLANKWVKSVDLSGLAGQPGFPSFDGGIEEFPPMRTPAAPTTPSTPR
jgi:hypothetical protein